ncbi:hypothetical protein Tco_0582991 [Tanacetum coccineum]
MRPARLNPIQDPRVAFNSDSTRKSKGCGEEHLNGSFTVPRSGTNGTDEIIGEDVNPKSGIRGHKTKPRYFRSLPPFAKKLSRPVLC